MNRRPTKRRIGSPKAPVGFRSHTFVPKGDQLQAPIRVKLEEDRDEIGDYLSAPWRQGNVIVSAAFKNLVSALDPELHYYFPIAIEHLNGLVDEDSHFLFKMGAFIEHGLIVEESDVGIHPAFPFYMAKSSTPRLMWRGSKVFGRHIWADAKLQDHIVVSDELYDQIKAHDLSGYVAKESRINSEL